MSSQTGRVSSPESPTCKFKLIIIEWPPFRTKKYHRPFKSVADKSAKVFLETWKWRKCQISIPKVRKNRKFCVLYEQTECNQWRIYTVRVWTRPRSNFLYFYAIFVRIWRIVGLCLPRGWRPLWEILDPPPVITVGLIHAILMSMFIFSLFKVHLHWEKANVKVNAKAIFFFFLWSLPLLNKNI